MVQNWRIGRNCILADEMGLGKTAQTVCVFQQLREHQGVKGPFLVVVPLSTTSHWQREVKNWTGLDAIVYHGSGQSREVIREHEFGSKDQLRFDVMITTYEMVNMDLAVLSKIQWEYLVVDEAHRLKNKNALLYKSLLTERRLKWRHCHLLTGTPIQNNLDELHSVLHFIDEHTFERESRGFLEEYTVTNAEDCVQLQELLAPYLLRRLKEDVDKTIAAKEETIIWVELCAVQKKYYRAVLDRNTAVLCKSGKKSDMPSLRNVTMELRKLCIHPYLLKNVEEQEAQDSQITAAEDRLIRSSGKFVFFDKLLPKLKADGHRLLVFSQWTRVLDLLEDVLIYREYAYERIDGNVTGLQRQQSIDRFQDPESDRFVFLLGTKAGGVGINLTAADTVVIFDSDWNPQNDLQAQARCHRIGQQKGVQVYRLVTTGTYEQKMFELSCKKLGLDQALLCNDVSQSEPDKQEMEDLLKFGAYDIMNDNGGEDLDANEDIDDILLKRAERRDLGGNGGNSSFSKAKFCAKARDGTEVDMEDPSFWQKVMPDEALNRVEGLVDGPRIRKQASRMNVVSNGAGVKTYEQDELGGDDDSDDSDLSDDFAPQSTKWNGAELKRMVDAMLELGPTRWGAVHKMAIKQNSKHSVEEVEAVGQVLLANIRDRGAQSNWEIKHDDGLNIMMYFAPNGMKFEDEEDAIDAGWCPASRDLPSEVVDYLKSPEFVGKVARKGARWELTIQKADKLAQLMSQSEQTPLSELLKDFSDESSIPCLEWSSAEFDEALLRGAHRHGLSRFDSMQQDVDLPFLSATHKPSAEASAATEDTDKATKLEVKCQELTGTLDLANSTVQFIENDVSTTVAASEFERRAGSKSKQWKKTIRLQPSGETVEKYLATIESAKVYVEVADVFERPYIKLRDRLERLLIHVGVIEVSKRTKKHKPAPAGPSPDASSVWSKRNTLQLFKALLLYGQSAKTDTEVTEDDMSALGKLANLTTKESSLLRDAVVRMLAVAHHHAAHPNSDEPRLLCGPEPSELIQVALLNQGCDSYKLPCAELQAVADGVTDEFQGWKIYTDLSHVQVKQLADRLQLLRWVRTEAQNHEHLGRFCRRLPAKGAKAGMPSWWKAGSYDIELVKAVATHGMSQEIWTTEPFTVHLTGTDDDFQEPTPKDSFVWSRLTKLRKILPKKHGLKPLVLVPVGKAVPDRQPDGPKKAGKPGESRQTCLNFAAPNKRSKPVQDPIVVSDEEDFVPPKRVKHTPAQCPEEKARTTSGTPALQVVTGSGDAGTSNFEECFAAEDETLVAIASRLGVEPTVLLKINQRRYPGLTENSKLMAGTSIVYPCKSQNKAKMEQTQEKPRTSTEAPLDTPQDANHLFKTKSNNKQALPQKSGQGGAQQDAAVKRRKIKAATSKPLASGMRSLTSFFNKVAPAPSTKA